MGEDLKPDFDALDEALKTLVLGVVAQARAESAELIRGELVCPCESYGRMEAIPYADGKLTYAHRTFRASNGFHSICYFGEWAARIVERGPRGERVPTGG